MAQLHVQSKRNNYWWLWLIIILIIIAGAVYWYLNYYKKDRTSVYDKTASSLPLNIPAERVGNMGVL
ncbi:MAG TPA: hypothetical protein VLM16_06500 [Ginsengibacter sp.]|nr:hypothetical protein [Ginsengibacter sp.]